MSAQSGGSTDPGVVVITATRTVQTVDDALAPVTVITRRDIERLQAQTFDDILRGVEGITLANSGGAGKPTSVFLRGASSTQVLVLVDGVKVGSPTTGLFAFQDVPVENIERIEIVRGPRSSLYGSEAIGGVIQIFTRRGGGASAPSFSVGTGSFGTRSASAGISGGGERAWFNVGAAGTRTDGIDACRGWFNPATFAGGGCFTVEPDKDGYRNRSQTGRAGYRFDGGAEVEAHGLHASGHSFYDGSFVNESRVEQEVYGLRLRLPVREGWRIAATSSRSADKSDNYKDGVFSTRFTTERDTRSVQSDWTLSSGQFATLGMDSQEDRVVESTTAYSTMSRGNRGLFGQFRAHDRAHDFEASWRRDVNQQFGDHVTRGFAWGYGMASGLRLIASYGTAFKAPAFNDLYYSSPFFNGNPNLLPERSQTRELGLRSAAAGSRWSIAAFQTDIRDLIVIAPSFTTMENVDTARVRGLEWRWSLRQDVWNFDAQASTVRPENQSPGPQYGRILPRRATRAGRIDLDRMVGGIHRVGMSVSGEGRRYDDAGNTIQLSGYALVDLRAEYAFDRSWRLQARAANLLDRHYETVAYYNQPGRAYYLTLRYQPGRS